MGVIKIKKLSRQDRNGTRSSEELRRRYQFKDINYTKEEIEKLKTQIVTDDYLSTTSKNPVQNKVITNALNTKVNKEEGKGLSSNNFTDEEKQQLANINIELANKVDKEDGKGLSSNDYTDAEKHKLESIPTDIEIKSNKVTVIDDTSTDEQYPSAKAVFNTMQSAQNLQVEDNLISTSATNALSANQGRILNEKIQIKNIMTAKLAEDVQFIAGTTSSKLILSNDVVTGENLSLSDDGGIEIGNGISKVLVNANVRIQNDNETAVGVYNLYIYKNNSIVTSGRLSGTLVGNSDGCTISQKLIEVAEGDIIYLGIWKNSSNLVTINSAYASTYLTVEVVE